MAAASASMSLAYGNLGITTIPIVTIAGDILLSAPSVTVPVSTNDQFLAFDTGSAGALKFIYMIATGPLTVETNSGSAPGQTFTLAANIPMLWATGMANANPVSVAIITGLYLTNASPTDAVTFSVYGVVDN